MTLVKHSLFRILFISLKLQQYFYNEYEQLWTCLRILKWRKNLWRDWKKKLKAKVLDKVRFVCSDLRYSTPILCLKSKFPIKVFHMKQHFYSSSTLQLAEKHSFLYCFSAFLSEKKTKDAEWKKAFWPALGCASNHQKLVEVQNICKW